LVRLSLLTVSNAPKGPHHECRARKDGHMRRWEITNPPPPPSAEPRRVPVPAPYKTDSVLRKHLIRVLTEEAIGLKWHNPPDKTLIAQVETFRDYLAGLDT
jgi:hypothetical protein